MKSPVVTVEKCASLREVAEKMLRHNIGLVVVVDENGKVYGVISERDFVRYVAQGLGPDTKAEEVASRPVLKVREDDPLHKAIELIQKHQVKHIVIVDHEDRPLGVISLRDLIDVDYALRNMAEAALVTEEEEYEFMLLYPFQLKVTC